MEAGRTQEQQQPDVGPAQDQGPGSQLNGQSLGYGHGEAVASHPMSPTDEAKDGASEEAKLLRDFQYVLDLVTTQAPCPPLHLPFVTAQSISDACLRDDLSMLLYRVTEVQEGLTAQEIMESSVDIKAAMDPKFIASMLLYVSPAAFKALDCPSLEKAKELIANVWGRSALQNEWRSIMRNYAAGILHATQQRGVIYQQDSVSAFNLATTYLVAEQEPSTGKTYLSVLRRVELLDAADERISSAAMLDLMALKYSSTMMHMVCPVTGRVIWQNNASCAAIGTLATSIALPVRGSCEVVDLDYLAQIFFGNQDVRRDMEVVVHAGSVYKRRMQIKGPELRHMLGAKPSQEIWHVIQFSTLKDPISHQLVIMMGQSDITDVVLAERRVKQLQKQQLNLLKEMLPQQVIELLLAQNKQRLSLAQSQSQSPFRTAADIAAFAYSGGSDLSSPSFLMSPVHNALLPSRRSSESAARATAATSEEVEEADGRPTPPLSEQRTDTTRMTLSPFASVGQAIEEASSGRDGMGEREPAAAVAHVRIADAEDPEEALPGPEEAGSSDGETTNIEPSMSLKSAFGSKSMNSGSHCVAAQDLTTLMRAMDECPIMSGYCLWNKADKVKKMKLDKRTWKEKKKMMRRCMTESRMKEGSRGGEGKEEEEEQDDREGAPGGAGERGQLAQGQATEPVQQQPEQQPEDGAYSVLEHERASSRLSSTISPGHSLTNSSTYGSDLQLSRRDVMSLATWHEEATILFTDLKGFTSMSSSLHPAQIMLFLNHLYSMFDDLVGHYDVYKVETIGDSYMVAAGLFDRSEPHPALQAGECVGVDLAGAPCISPLQLSSTDILIGADSRAAEAAAVPRESADGASPSAGHAAATRDILGGHDPQHASKMIAFAKAMLESASKVVDPLGNRVQMRVGIHTGSVMSGVVGRKCPRFCLFGDTVNTASRMESTGEPGRIHASQEFRDLVPEEKWLNTEVYAKGKGTLSTYYLDFELPEPEDNFGDEALLPSYL